ncbi:MAG TPA: PD-(D/E)XK nuclease family protein, partial [Planctomycetaceae bacterium]|nr:PD-(D/E)XK nuclease family protein [Planctomycetaceae bacterium]
STHPTRLDTADVLLWERLQRTLRDAAAADALRTPSPPVLDLAEFLAEFRDLLASEFREPDAEAAGMIRVLGVEQVRHLDAPVLILVGLTEDSFPRGRSDDCLFPDAERRRLSQAGLPMRHAAQHQQDDLFLFFTLLQRWQRRLVLTYSAINTRGHPTFPSPYVTALRTLFTADSLPVHHEGKLDPIPDATHMLSATDQRLAAWEAARTGRPGWLRTLWEQPSSRSTLVNVAAAVEMAVHRFHTPGFTAYEGRLAVETNRQAVAKRFGVQRQFSATELEAYANCPFRFWLETGLGIEPVSAVEDGTDHRERGSLVHAVLSKLSPDIDAGRAGEELADRFRDLVEDRLQKTVSVTELQRALTRIERQLLDQWAAAYADQCDVYTEQIQIVAEGRWQVLDTEYPFGDVPGAPEDAKARTLSFGETSNRVQVRGRIDRVDVGQYHDRPAFMVIDYKTGRRPRFSEDDVRSGRALQLMLYALAVRRLGLAPADALPFQLGYWCLKETGFQGGVGTRSQQTLKPIDAAAWQTLERLVDEVVPQLAQGIRAGEFVVDNPDEHCTGYCEFRTVCRVNQIRPLADRLVKLRASYETAPTIPEPQPATKPARKGSR